MNKLSGFCIFATLICIMNVSGQFTCLGSEPFCCNSINEATSSAVSSILGLLGIVITEPNALVGVGCSPATPTGCSAAKACCTGDAFNGVIVLNYVSGQFTCTAGQPFCCNSINDATSSAVSQLLGLLGIVLPQPNTLVGVACSPATPTGFCPTAQACCTGNAFNGLIVLDCERVN